MNQKETQSAVALGAGQKTGVPFPARPLLNEALEHFQKVTGVSAVLAPPAPPRVPVRFGQNEFCRQLWKSCAGGCLECHQHQQELFRRLDSKLETQRVCCGAGLLQFAVPVLVEGRHGATLLGGKVRLQPAREEEFKSFAARLGLERTSERVGKLRAAYFRSPVLTPAKLLSSLQLLDSLARLFAELAGGPATPVVAESPYVTRAKAYVQSHLSERLTTRQMAEVLHLNESYFCRHFRRFTGMTFHAYLGNARVEAAKTRLLNSLDPITDIGYVAGFQSISDFNRVFKSKVGASPSQFRREAQRSLVALFPAGLTTPHYESAELACSPQSRSSQGISFGRKAGVECLPAHCLFGESQTR